MAGGSLLRCTVLRNTLTWPRPTGEINKPKIGGEGGIRSHGTVTRTTVFEIIIQAQIGTGGKVNSRWFRPLIWTYFRASLVYWKRVRYRWLRAPDLNLHLDF